MPHPRRRPAATTVETAIVLAVLLLLVVGLIVGGMGVFRQQQVAALACEGARWASARGADYQRDTNGPSPTRQRIVEEAVAPFAVGLDATALAVRVEWIDRGTNTVTAWDAATKDVRSVSASGEYVTNSVRVTVTYTWTPGAFWEPLALTGVSEVPMTN